MGGRHMAFAPSPTQSPGRVCPLFCLQPLLLLRSFLFVDCNGERKSENFGKGVKNAQRMKGEGIVVDIENQRPVIVIFML